jgi:hypothetical protein
MGKLTSIPNITQEGVDACEPVLSGRREAKMDSTLVKGSDASTRRNWKWTKEEAARKVSR